MSQYSATKTHNYMLSKLVRNYVDKSEGFKSFVRVNSLHPGFVSTNIIKHKKAGEDYTVTTDECVHGAISDLPSEDISSGAT